MIGDMSNHLWQSTLFAVAVGLIAVALRRTQARIRYWLWFSASVKFFVPFALLITFGSQLEWRSTALHIAPSTVSSAMVQISEPFSDISRVVVEPPTASTRVDAWSITVAILALAWASGTLALTLTRFRLSRHVRAVVLAGRRCHMPGIPAGVDVRSAPGLMGPGVVGWWRPVLLVPQGIEDHLTPRQLEAVIAHELCHIRRRDNVMSAIHMVVEAAFWFHPLVWWIGARLLDERERACDEEVLRLGNDPKTYAEGILNVCKRYTETPLVCVSGVSGASLRTRVEAIMTNRVGRRLNFTTKVALTMAAMTALILPVVVGAMSPVAQGRAVVPEAIKAQHVFEVASVKENRSGSRQSNFVTTPGRVTATNVSLYQLISVAYNGAPMPMGTLEGAPNWALTDHYDIIGTHDSQTASPEEFQQMLRALLSDRFGLRMHQEPRQRPLYVLMLAENDDSLRPGLRRSSIECGNAEPSEPRRLDASADGVQPCQLRTFPGRITGRAVTIDMLVKTLVGAVEDHREIRDQTGLNGRFDVDLEWLPDNPAVNLRPPDAPPLPVIDPNGAPLGTALREQLGLRLVAQRASSNVWVIDRVDRPTTN